MKKTYLEYQRRIDHYRSEAKYYNQWAEIWKAIYISLLCSLSILALIAGIYEAI